MEILCLSPLGELSYISELGPSLLLPLIQLWPNTPPGAQPAIAHDASLLFGQAAMPTQSIYPPPRKRPLWSVCLMPSLFAMMSKFLQFFSQNATNSVNFEDAHIGQNC